MKIDLSIARGAIKVIKAAIERLGYTLGRRIAMHRRKPLAPGKYKIRINYTKSINGMLIFNGEIVDEHVAHQQSSGAK